jgi:hypothetical protein
MRAIKRGARGRSRSGPVISAIIIVVSGELGLVRDNRLVEEDVSSRHFLMSGVAF